MKETDTRLVIVPTYNERQNLAPLAEAVLDQGGFDLLVVDDNSPDGTGQLADALAQRFPTRVHVLHRAGKLGLGSAYIAGFKWGLDRGYGTLFEMDADFSHNPRDLPRLREALEEADLVIGSRNITGGGTEQWPVWRSALSRGGSLYARAILDLPVRDLTSGFKGFRRRALEALDLDAIRSNGYSFQIEVTYRCHQLGFRVAEVPIVFVDRRVGRSKMSRRIVLEAVLMTWRLKLGLVPHAPRPARREPAISGGASLPWSRGGDRAA